MIIVQMRSTASAVRPWPVRSTSGQLGDHIDGEVDRCR